MAYRFPLVPLALFLCAASAGAQPAPPVTRPAPPGQPSPSAPPARDPSRTAKLETATIKGRVVSADGRPLRRAQVRVSAPELRDARTASTDTEGQYEVTDLPAGRYQVRISRSGYVPLQYGQRYPGELGKPVPLGVGETIAGINVALPRAGVIAGRITDETGDPIAGVHVFAMQLRYHLGRRRIVPAEAATRTDDAGQYRLVGLTPGDYYVMGSTRESWVVGGKDKTVLSFAPTYYPGVPTLPTAQRIKIALGQEVPAMDFALAVGRAASASGVALGATGAPLAGARISLNQEFMGPSGGMMLSAGSATAAADGSWKLANIAPGEYKLSVRSADAGGAEGATQMLTMDGSDVEGLTLGASTGGVVSGQVILEGQAELPVPLTRLRVAARSVDGIRMTTALRPENGAADEQGRFTLDNIVGAHRLSVTGIPDGWGLKAIERDGQELADTDINMRSGERWEGVKVVLTNRLTTVTGVVKTDRDEQAASGTVVVFADDAGLWGEASRHVRGVRPSQTGEFEIKGLMPGSYLAIAIEYMREGDWSDPEVLESLRDRATRFKLGEGEQRAVNLELKR